jgi:hypothetical protein
MLDLQNHQKCFDIFDLAWYKLTDTYEINTRKFQRNKLPRIAAGLPAWFDIVALGVAQIPQVCAVYPYSVNL